MRCTLLGFLAVTALAAAGAAGMGRAEAFEAPAAAGGCTGGEGAGEQCIASSKGSNLLQARLHALQEEVQEAEEAHEADSEEWPAGLQGPAADEAALEEELVESGGARALLSRRGCPNCVCFAEDAARCGSSIIKDAARCGVDTVKECLNQKFRVDCFYKTFAKSCNVANKCEFTESFSDCLSDLTSSFGGQEKDFMRMVAKTGCTSAESCKKQVTDGLSDAWKKMKSGVMSEGKEIVSRTRTSVSNVGDTATNAYNKAKGVVAEVGAEAEDVGASVMEYIKGGQPPAWPKYDLGEVCAPEGRGFWYLYPTDCGAFSSMAGIFSDMRKAGKHFGDAKRAFGTCVGLEALLGVPTPFIKLGWTPFCLYQPIATAMEYIIGGISARAVAAAPLLGHVEAVMNELSSLASELRVVEMAKDLHAEAKDLLAQGASSPEMQAASQKMCGRVPTWSVELSLGWTAGYSLPHLPPVGFGLAMGLVVGCKDGALMPPNWVLTVEFFAGVQLVNKPKLGLEAGLEVGLKFDSGYPTFSRRMDVGFALNVEPEVDLKELTAGQIPIAAAVPIEFSLNPLDHPTAFAMAIKPEVEIGVFAQLGREARAASEAASRLALARGANPALAAIAGSLHAVAGRRAELRAALAGSLRPRAEIVEHARALHRDKGAAAAALVERAQRRLAGTEGAPEGKLGALQEGAAASEFPAEVSIEAKVGFAFCITPVQCFGS